VKRKLTVREQIIEQLLDIEKRHTKKTITKKIGKPSHDYTDNEFKVLENRGWIKTKKDKNAGGSGAKPSVVELNKDDLDTLKDIWKEHHNLHSKIFGSSYHHALIPEMIKTLIPEASEKTPNLKELLTILAKISPTTIEIGLGFYPDWVDVVNETRMINIHDFELKKIASELKDIPHQEREKILEKISYLFLVAFVKDSLDKPQSRSILKEYLFEASDKMRYLPGGE
jgi:hypothetical protein